MKNNTPVNILGGTISNVNTGIFLNNYDGYNIDASFGAHATISGISINPNSSGTGIRVFDNPLATSNANVEATIGVGNSITGGTSGIVIENSSAKVNSPLGNVIFAGQTGDYIKLISNTNNLDAKTASFDGILPQAMTLAQRTALENKLTHKPDNSALGLITYFYPVHNVTQDTYFSNIQPAIDAAVVGNTIELAEWNFNERVVIDKSLTLQGVNTDKSLTVIDGTGLTSVGSAAGDKSGIKINPGVIDVTIKNLTIQNFTGGSGNNDAGIYAIGGNNNLLVTNVALKNNVSASGFYANGPVNTVSITNSLVENNGGGARGIVIWNGFKENITITGNTVTNNICCGIELQDGTASAVNISGNTVSIGSGDNALGINGLRTLTGSNTIANNIITGGGRFGIELKNPSDNDGGANTTIVSGNSVTLSSQNSDLRDRAGIAVFRRVEVSGNPDNHPDAPNGVIISNNIVNSYKQNNSGSSSTGFGIVVEGENHALTGNTLTNNDVGIQQQAGHTPFVSNTNAIGNQADIADLYFGRGNSPTLCNITLSGNSYSGNGVNERIVIGGGTGTIATAVTPTVNDVTDILVCNGTAIPTITFTGNNIPGVVYNWTNTNAAIGIATSGSGNITGYTASNTTSLAITATITVTPVVNGCQGAPQDFTIIINPTPTVNVVANQTLCAGGSTSAISFSGTGTSYAWVNDNSAIGLALSGTGDIPSFTATNSTGVPQIAYVTVTPNFTGSSLSCAGQTRSFSISVKDNAPAELICQDDVEIDNDLNLCTAVYSFQLPKAYDPVFFDGFENANWQTTNLGWSNYNSSILRELSSVSLVSSEGSAHGNINSITLPASPDDYTGAFSRLGGYSSTFGNGFRNRVDVYIDLTDPAVVGNTYGWDVSSAVSNQSNLHRRDFVFHAASDASGKVLIGASNGSNFAKRNDLASLNHHEITSSGWYTFEWMFVNKGDGTLKADLSVLDNTGSKLWTETRNDPSDVIATQIGGNRYMWFTFIEADNLRIDNVEKANILNTTSNVASGYAFPVGTTTVTVTSAADACGAQASCTFDVKVKDVKPPLFTNCPTSVVVCETDAEYTWTHVTLTDQCSLSGGLQELTYTLSGATTSSPTTVASFDGSTMGTETFNVGTTTVTYSGKDAAGNLVSNVCSFTVLVKPEPVGTVSVPTQTVCSDATISEIILGTSNSLSGTTYSWSRDKTTEVTGLATTGTTNISGIPNNVTGVPQIITYTITPTIDGCIGNTFTASVTVNPEPVGVATLSSQTVCSDIAISEIVLSTSNSISGTTYTWTRDKTTEVTGLAASGSGNITGTPNNITGSSQTVTYTITPTSGTCVGNNFTATVVVKPEPVGVPTPLTQTVCSDENITPIALPTSNSLSGTTYSWSRDKLEEITGLASTGTANISGSGNNVTLANQTVTYTITPTFGGCVGNTFTSAITIKPEPNPVPTTTIQKCSAEPFTFDFDTYIQNNSADLGQVTYTYSVVKVPNLPLLDPDPVGVSFTSSNGEISNTITNFGTNPITVRYTTTPIGANGCLGTPFVVNVVINPAPVVNIYPNGSDDLCAGDSRIISGGVSPTGTYTNVWSIDSQTSGIGASLSSTGSISTSLIIPANAMAGTIVVKFLATNTATGCSSSTLYTFTVKEKPVITITTPSISNCEGVSTPGKASFDFTAAGVSALPVTAGISYHTSASDAQNNLGAITNTTSFLGSNNQIIYVRATNGACFAVSTFTLIVNPTPAVPTLIAVAPTCTSAGTSTISNYSSANTYTFTPAGPTVGAGGLITGMTVGTPYTVTSGIGTCTSAASATFTNAAMLATPAVPTITSTAATCSAAEISTIGNYVATGVTYTFTPTGPTVGSGGVISGMTEGTSYTVNASSGSCTSASSAIFSNDAMLETPAVPTISSVAANCESAGTSSIVNYVATNTYTFTPAGPTVGAGGLITGMIVGTPYTVTSGIGTCTSAASATFTNAAMLATPAVPTITSTAATCSAAEDQHDRQLCINWSDIYLYTNRSNSRFRWSNQWHDRRYEFIP